jgi:hypothetical protein
MIPAATSAAGTPPCYCPTGCVALWELMPAGAASNAVMACGTDRESTDSAHTNGGSIRV